MSRTIECFGRMDGWTCVHPPVAKKWAPAASLYVRFDDIYIVKDISILKGQG